MFWLLVAVGLSLAILGLIRAPVHVSLALVREAGTELHVGLEWLFLRLDRRLGDGCQPSHFQ